MNEIIKKNGINFGIITGVISVLITSSVYIIDLSLMTKWWLGLSILAIYIVVGCVLLSKTRKYLGGFMSFKEGFTTYFISALIGVAISVLFNILLFNFIDTDAADVLKEKTIEKTVQMMENFNTPNEAIAAAVDQIESQNQWSIGNILKGLAGYIVFFSVIGLIVAAAMKKSKPDTE